MRRALRRFATLLMAAFMLCLIIGAGLHAQSRSSDASDDERPSGSKKNRGPARPITIPITILLWTHRSGRCSQEPGDGGLSELGKKCPAWQSISAAILFAGFILLISEAIFGAA